MTENFESDSVPVPMAWVRRLEALSVQRHARVRRRKRAVLYVAEIDHAGVAEKHVEGR
ncbi:hypothetical protein AWB69_00897 [Caballeronia udeis]|uniref:Uncharacterized protein n=1 Tax=Caballeronia udeis TaxID=1232866 RepID=A0A158FBC3_9BURK|nr:hypothetical protein AWB69_00897 [Caballeronia udeis]